LTDAKSDAGQWSWTPLTAYEIEHRTHHHFLESFGLQIQNVTDNKYKNALAQCNHRAHTARAHINDRGHHSKINTLCWLRELAAGSRVALLVYRTSSFVYSIIGSHILFNLATQNCRVTW
jgi:hypothetical protein